MNKKVHWGIIGLGKIAHKFAADLLLSPHAVLHAVASRDGEKAQAFKKQYQANLHNDSYADLVKNPDIDVIYIATPHAMHFENTMLCLKHGKNVLCEKPMGINQEQVATMIAEAQSRKLFLMEGIWTRFIPATVKVIELLENKTLGEILFMRADFGFNAPKNFEGRIYNKKLGGGSLLDLGIYPIYLSILTLGMPQDLKVMARFTKTQVDSYCAMLLDYSNGSKAILESTIEADTPTEAIIYGTLGTLKIHSRFHHAQQLTLSQQGVETVINLPYTGNGYIHEIEEVNFCIMHSLTQSDKLPQSITTQVNTVIEAVKKEMGLLYE